MANNNPYAQNSNAYEQGMTDILTDATEYVELSMSMSDDDLQKMLINSLESDRAHWNKAPWNLQETDVNNTKFLFGNQMDNPDDLPDNRIFSSARAILSYATGQLAKPDITPSKGDEIYLKGARDIGAALYQHALDEQVDFKVRATVLNLISRKRGFLKLRFDPEVGLNGDIVTEVCNPEDIIICQYAGYLKNPSKIYHRISASIQSLCDQFPNKAEEIKRAYGIERGVHTQMSRMVPYFECWFTYSEGGKSKEGVCWFIHEKKLILDKMPNPNWVYLKSDKKEKEANVTSIPPKPFVPFNYINTGHSYIDETCLVEQAIPLQKALNKRLKQLSDNYDYVNGRWLADSNSFSEADAKKLVNKGPRTVAMVDMKKVPEPLRNVAPNQLGSEATNSVFDYRNEIDGMMGTPSQFKGDQPQNKDTLGRDLMIKQQAGALQDDLVRAIAMGMEKYYTLLLQMMRVYYTDDYWFQTKGGNGKFQFILINGDKLDSNVKVSVQTDSTLPLDKASIRATAMQLWQAGNAISYEDLMKDLGLPNPEERTERYLKQNTMPQQALADIEAGKINDDAESDIQLLIAKKTPEERDNYDQAYFDYLNKYLASNRFAKLQGENPEAAQRVTMFVIAVQHAMMESLLKQEQLTPPVMPGQTDPNMVQSSPVQGAAPQAPSTPNPAMQPAMPPTGAPAAPPVPTQ